MGFVQCSDSSKPQGDVNNQCQLGSTEWNLGPATLQWGGNHCSSAQCHSFRWGCMSCCSWWGIRQLTALWAFFVVVAVNGEKKWEVLELCLEVLRTEQQGCPPGTAAWATSNQAKVRHKHSLLRVWLGFLCTGT